MTFSAVKSGAFSGFVTETVYNTGRKGKREVSGKTNCNKNVIFFKKGVKFSASVPIYYVKAKR